MTNPNTQHYQIIEFERLQTKSNERKENRLIMIRQWGYCAIIKYNIDSINNILMPMMKVMKMTKDETNFENMKEFFLQIYIYLSIKSD